MDYNPVDEPLPDVSEEVAACNISLITGQVAKFFVDNERQMCDAEAIASALSSGDGSLHPPILVEKALQELQLMGALYVAKEAEQGQDIVRIYSLNDYMIAQAVVDEVDDVSL